ncbi:OmpH family outer membrane protein [Telluribacter sp.]|jgi:outer membrane protein|uniref:OmpH family outer membrane protein n=1 Tax=Telluribacter sp. TaxID=1978767 RepID=UPI002E14B4D6|nr:OmpH family outer membrane protein [Telluribacter sp.]
MKNKLIALLALFAIVSTPLLAQTTPATTPTKIGYTNVDYILLNLPESKKVQNELEVTKAQLDKALQDKYKEFQDKLDVYNKTAQSMTDVIRADKEKELQNLQTSIQEFQRNSEQSLQNKYQTLLNPVMDKINEAIKAVGLENNYLYILNTDAGQNTTPILLYVGSEDNNVSNLVLRKLGVDPTKIAEPAAAGPASKPNAPAPKANTPAPKK